ncbi:MAG: enoyl-CoA hydratase-related protein [Pseudomonadota bacterium]
MTYTTILLDRPEDGLGLITLNRPDRLNAWTPTMMAELIDAVGLLDNDDDVRAVVVTGAGRAFCAGADLSPEDWDKRTSQAVSDDDIPRDTAGRFTLAVYEMKKPIIAAINGHATGVGITMTLPMDVRVAADTSKIGFVFNRRGMVPEGCSTWFLPRIVGVSLAAELMLSGRIISGKDALDYGLVSRIAPADQVLAAALGIAREIRDNTSALSAAFARRMIWDMLGASHPMEAHRVESQSLHFMFQSQDLVEGVFSFLEKRPPRFPLKPNRDLPGFFPWKTSPPFKE